MTSERTPQDVLREDRFRGLVLRIQHRIGTLELGRSKRAIEQARVLYSWITEQTGQLDKAIAEAPDSPRPEAEVTSFDVVWYSPCGYEWRGLFAASSPIPSCPQCHSTTWSTLKPMVLAAPDTLSEKPGLDALVGRTTDTHRAALDVGGILAALQARKGRLRGLWVQYHGDGTDRARRKGDVVVSVQYDHVISDAAFAEQGQGQSVREASQNLVARLSGSTDSEGR